MINNNYWIKLWFLNNDYNVFKCLIWSSDCDFDGIVRGFCMIKFVGFIIINFFLIMIIFELVNEYYN